MLELTPGSVPKQQLKHNTLTKLVRDRNRKRRVHRERRQYAIQLLGGKCHLCGVAEGHEGTHLQFHHTDREAKVFEICRCSMVSWNRFLDEVQKCVLLCFDCHVETHRKHPREPGTGVPEDCYLTEDEWDTMIGGY